MRTVPGLLLKIVTLIAKTRERYLRGYIPDGVLIARLHSRMINVACCSVYPSNEYMKDIFSKKIHRNVSLCCGLREQY